MADLPISRIWQICQSLGYGRSGDFVTFALTCQFTEALQLFQIIQIQALRGGPATCH
jgi:hypothetical protein